MKATILKLFKPTVYYVESDKFLGDFTVRVPNYTLTPEHIMFKNSDNETVIVGLNKLFFFESNAKKEAAKSVLPVNEGNLRLVKEIESQGIKLKPYQKQQIIEDGEASEIYQELVSK